MVSVAIAAVPTYGFHVRRWEPLLARRFSPTARGSVCQRRLPERHQPTLVIMGVMVVPLVGCGSGRAQRVAAINRSSPVAARASI